MKRLGGVLALAAMCISTMTTSSPDRVEAADGVAWPPASIPLDWGFDAAGQLPVVSAVRHIEPLADGSILAFTGFSVLQVTKLRADGTLDHSFGSPATPGHVSTGIASSYPNVAVQRDGRVLISDGDVVRRMSSAGEMEAQPLFTNGPLTAVRVLGVDPQGRPSIAGRLGPASDNPTFVSVRLGPDDQIDPTYASGSATPGMFVLSAGRPVLASDGGVYVVDEFQVRRVTPDGVADTGFGGGAGAVGYKPSNTFLEVDDIAADRDGGIILSGQRLPACNSCAFVARIRSATGLDGAFASNVATGGSFGSIARALTLPDGHVGLVVGRPNANPQQPGASTWDTGVLTVDDAGRPTTTFGWGSAVGGLALFGWPAMSGAYGGIAVDATGRLVVAGYGQRLVRTRPAGRLGFQSLVPTRLLDTRAEPVPGTLYIAGYPQAGTTVEVPVTGRTEVSIPADVAAVAVNVTGTNAFRDGYVTVWPCGAARPLAANLNLTKGSTSPNMVIVRVGTNGRICLYTQSGTDFVVDIAGYFPSGSDFVPEVPERLLDTRSGSQVGYAGAKPVGQQVVELQVTGRGALVIPDDASAVVLNVTGVGATADGYVTAWPCGTDRPLAANLNLTAGSTIPNLVLVKVGAGGKVCLYTQSGTDLVADLSGFFPAHAAFSAVVPSRVLDTRVPTQIGYEGTKPSPGTIVELQVTGRGGPSEVPAGATAVVLNLTGTEATADGYVTAWPCGGPRPVAANLNLVGGETRPNLVIVRVGTGGKVCLFTQQGTHLVADVSGYFTTG